MSAPLSGKSLPAEEGGQQEAYEGAAAAFSRLFAIVRRLRAPDGCPWDREQTPETLRTTLVEEAWEAVSAINTHDDANLREELGDIFLNIVMIAWMREQEGAFRVQDSLEEIAEKLVRRHPHVFGTSTASTAGEVLRQWDEIKHAEKAAAGGGFSGPPSALDHVPASLPPLERAHRIQRKAAKIGFDWPSASPVWQKVEEELAELQAETAAGAASSRTEEEAGDVLFSVVNLLRKLHVDPGLALHRANEKFERRFRAVEKLLASRGVAADRAGLEKLDAAWEEVKAGETGLDQDAEAAAGREGVSGGADGEHSASK